MDKVKLPKEVAEAMQRKIDLFGNEGTAYVMWECSSSPTVISKWIDCDKDNIIKLSQALVNGYEVEQTPEEKVREYFNTITPKGWKFIGDANDPVYIERNAIRQTASFLNHKIDGINT